MSMNRKYEWISRILAGTQLLFILLAFYAVYYPVVVLIRDGEDLTLLNSAAPDITLAYLGWALITGSLLIFPALFYLYRIFKSDKSEEVSV
jgi:cytochrome d ubiquinol oxidase subunit II